MYIALMEKGLKYILYITAILLTIGGLSTCKKPYNPPAITANYNYLVVEGLININDSTFINLSRTVSIASVSTTKPELKAIITIESNQGASYALKEVGKGLYVAPSYNLSAANQYRLRIKTTTGSTYTSDFVETKITPPIDSIIREMKPDGLHININTHDPKNTTRYYRWDYSEAWQFTSFFESHATAENAATSPLFAGYGIAVVPRKDDIYHCWGGDTSATILINSTAGLSQDVLSDQPITFVASGAEKLSVRYSINIRQYALTQDAYNFWTLLKKNTEQLGSIFDSQPSASVGNFHNINNPNEPVIGFMSVCSVSQTRIYIDHTALPYSYINDYINNRSYNKYTCVLDTLAVYNMLLTSYDELSNFIVSYPHSPQTPVEIIKPFNPLTLAGSASGALTPCVDCTLRGKNVKPAFWQ